MKEVSSLQVGKLGITDNFKESLKSHFKNHDIVKISILKSFTRDREKIRKLADEMIEYLGRNYVHRVIGFTIILRKMRKNVR